MLVVVVLVVDDVVDDVVRVIIVDVVKVLGGVLYACCGNFGVR